MLETTNARMKLCLLSTVDDDDDGDDNCYENIIFVLEKRL